MNAMIFDTHAFVRRLREGGFSESQAEAVTEALKGAMSGSELVTRDYLDAKLPQEKADIVKWLAGLLLAQAGLVAALVKLL